MQTLYARFIFLIAFIIAVFSAALIYEHKTPLISLFPLEKYDQTLSDWQSTKSLDDSQSLLNPKQIQVKKNELYQHYFGVYSPWNQNFIENVLNPPSPQNIFTVEQEKLASFDNRNKPKNTIGYGVNFRPYTNQWFKGIENLVNIAQFGQLHYSAFNRAIAIDNLNGRVIPTDDVYFYSANIAGEGYPFDYAEASAVWAGTPLYILGESSDHAWNLVATPSMIVWVKSNGIARVDPKFILAYQQQAKKHLIAITAIKTPISDQEASLFRFSAYIGMIFPGEIAKNGFKIIIPVSNLKKQAVLYHAWISADDATLLPLLPSPKHFFEIIERMINRPYGWGNLYFYNDCAAELKNLFTVFGIWLPIHSSNQVNSQNYLINTVDLSSKNLENRLDNLKQYGHPFMTIIYVGHHVILYLGNYVNIHDPLQQEKILTYQNAWGLKPKNPYFGKDFRAILGGSIILPLQKYYPESPHVASQADRDIFIMAYLDQWPTEKQEKPEMSMDLKDYMSP